jgi:hypothetical protein
VRVTLKKHGGLAPVVAGPPCVVDSSQLPEAAAAELKTLTALAQRDVVTDVESPGRARDAMSYTLSIEEDGAETVIRQSDLTMTSRFARLINWIESHSRGRQ